jgi:hypothetical protein
LLFWIFVLLVMAAAAWLYLGYPSLFHSL